MLLTSFIVNVGDVGTFSWCGNMFLSVAVVSGFDRVGVYFLLVLCGLFVRQIECLVNYRPKVLNKWFSQ
jgi:hypothetical protein